MISKANERMTLNLTNLCGGVGNATFHPLFERGVLPRNVTLVTLEPGASCGEHLHDKDAEIFYVTEGELVLQDDGEEYVLHAGDAEYCGIGHSHGVINRSDSPASYLAIGL